MNWIAHGSWLGGTFFLWAESSEAAPRKGGRKLRIPPHPQAASPDSLRAVLGDLMPAIEWEAIPMAERAILPPPPPPPSAGAGA